MKSPVSAITKTNLESRPFDASSFPPFLDAGGIRKYVAPIGRTLLYELDSRGEITSASLGLGRGRRVYLVPSVLAWLERRMSSTQRPKMAPRQNAAKQTEQSEKTMGVPSK